MKVEKYLDSHQIEYKTHEHPAVYTCDEAEKHCSHIPGFACKNLFLRSKKRNRLFLVIMGAEKKMDIKKFESIVGEKVSFGSSELLKEKLEIDPGSVSPFGLINDVSASVELFIDQPLYDAEIVNFHPNVNTATLELNKTMFHKFLETLKQKWEVINL